MGFRPTTLRLGSLIAAAAMAVHELRFLIAAPANGEPAPGHGYLALVGIAVAVALGGAAAGLVRRIDAASKTGEADCDRNTARVWLVASISVFAIFAVQESLEGLLVAGRASGLDAFVGDGAWVAMPLAAAGGGLVALAMRGAEVLIAAAARRGRRGRVLRRPMLVIGARRPALRAAMPVLAAEAAGRAPPAWR